MSAETEEKTSAAVPASAITGNGLRARLAAQAVAAGWDDIDVDRLVGVAVDAVAWDLLDQTGDLADRSPSITALGDARATAEHALGVNEVAPENALAVAVASLHRHVTLPAHHRSDSLGVCATCWDGRSGGFMTWPCPTMQTIQSTLPTQTTTNGSTIPVSEDAEKSEGDRHGG